MCNAHKKKSLNTFDYILQQYYIKGHFMKINSGRVREMH